MARHSDVAEVEWKILTEIENSQKTTQRSLSGQLNLALGAVNFHLKRMVRKGYVKMKTLPPNRAIYFVTPSGLSRKLRLTYEYMVGTLDFYREARKRSRELFDRLQSEGIRQVAFLGAADLAEICYLSLHETDIELEGIYDDSRAGENFLGHRVRPEKELNPGDTVRVIFTQQQWATRGKYNGREDVEFVF